MNTPAADFDFFFGSWTVQHRRLRRRLVACGDWDVYEGSCQVLPILGGQGNVDDNLLALPGGSYRAATLRSVDPVTGLWSIWWLDGRHPGHLDVPVVGQFVDGVGTFLADDTLDGRAIRVRFLWCKQAADTGRPRWEQAFSVDGGLNWETNWVMDFCRDQAAQAQSARASLSTCFARLDRADKNTTKGMT